FRSEKDTNWEGAFRVPAMIRWPGHIKAGEVCNEIVSALDWSPTLVAAAGMPDVKDRLLKGYTAGAKTVKVHQDGYNLLPFLTGQETRDPRREFFLFQRRWRHRRPPRGELEGRVRRAAGAWHDADLGGAVHGVAAAEAVRPARRSVRAR